MKNKINGAEAICCVGNSRFSQNRTLCGIKLKNNIFYKKIGDLMTGKINNVTCPICKELITYIKSEE